MSHSAAAVAVSNKILIAGFSSKCRRANLRGQGARTSSYRQAARQPTEKKVLTRKQLPVHAL